MKGIDKRIIIIFIAALLITAFVVWHYNQLKKLELAMDNVDYNQKSFQAQIKTEIALKKPSKTCFQHAIDLTAHLERIIEAGSYRDLANGNIRHKEKVVHRLIMASDYDLPFTLVPEPNYGRGPVDFGLYQNGDKTQIEVKIATNSKIKHLKAQLEVYSKASGIKHTVVPIIYFDSKQKERIERIISELSFEETTKIVLINADPKTKISGSNSLV